MSIGKRIRELRQRLGMSQADFCSKIGVKQSPLSQMESGKILPSIETISNIIRIFNISYSWLIDGIEEKPNIKESSSNEKMNKTMSFSDKSKNAEKLIVSLNEEQSPLYSKMPKIVTVDASGKDNIVLVPVKAAAGYLLGYGDAGYIQSLPTFSLPTIQNGTFRMFQVSGNSMYPTLSDKCYVVGEWVENWIKDVKDNRIYVIVCDNGVLVKRVLNRLKKYENLYLKSDNRKEYPNVTLEPGQIKEVWAVKMHLSFELPDPTVLYDRVGDLEAEIDYIKSLLKKKN